MPGLQVQTILFYKCITLIPFITLAPHQDIDNLFLGDFCDYLANNGDLFKCYKY